MFCIELVSTAAISDKNRPPSLSARIAGLVPPSLTLHPQNEALVYEQLYLMSKSFCFDLQDVTPWRSGSSVHS